MTKFRQEFATKIDGWSRWIFPSRTKYKLACCDCGLVHDWRFRLRGKHIEFKVRVNKRSTAAIRRHDAARKLRDAK